MFSWVHFLDEEMRGRRWNRIVCIFIFFVPYAIKVKIILRIKCVQYINRFSGVDKGNLILTAHEGLDRSRSKFVRRSILI